MIGSLFAGVSGLNANAIAMTVIGDNIANVNTTAFKSSNASFVNILSQSLEGSTGNEIGRGVQFGGVSTSWSQGTLENTSSPTDMAINGKGFFMLNDSGGSSYYSRAGSFHYDKTGNLMNPAGLIVQGFKFDLVTGELGATPQDIIVSGETCPPDATSEMALTFNLDGGAYDGEPVAGTLTVDCGNANADITYTAANTGVAGNNISIEYVDSGAGGLGISVAGNTITVDLGGAAPDATTVAAAINVDAAAGLLVSAVAEGDGSGLVEVMTAANLTGGADAGSPETYSSTMTVYDSLGTPIALRLDFTKTATGWSWAAVPSDGSSTSFGSVEFNEDGDVISPVTNPLITVTGLSSGATNLNIEWHLIDTNGGVSGWASPSNTSFQTQNGFPSGTLQGTSTDEDGIITGVYSNGQLEPLYQLALADFPSYSGLGKMGDNLYSESLSSGDALPGVPGSGRLGSISPNSLEMSNVDLASEFVKMITTQRAFQANSRVITTSDEILQELINLKR